MSFLRKIITASVCITGLTTAHAQTLFTYGAKSVSKDEFLKAYNKNNTEAAPTDQSYRDYLDLYTRFKIKVQAALTPNWIPCPTRTGARRFPGQVVESYMNDDASVNVLMDEAMERSNKDLHLAHIFVAASSTATAEQIQQAQQKIKAAFARLQAGDDFTKTALTYSEDPSVQSNKGDLGFITVFVLPYAMESLVYNTAVGKFTEPSRSKNGFHIFKVLEERKAFGKMRAAQILLAFTPDATDAQKQATAKKADSSYNALQQGSDLSNSRLHSATITSLSKPAVK